MKARSITLPVSGYTIAVRPQSAMVTEGIGVRANAEYEGSKPKPPVQRIETAPGEFRDIAQLQDPTYVQELEAWQSKVSKFQFQLTLDMVASVGIVHDETFQEIMRDCENLMPQYRALGIDIPDSKPKFALLYIIAPAEDDLNTILFEVIGRGLPREEQVRMRRMMFQDNVSQAPAEHVAESEK